MKKISFILLAISIIFIACKDDNSSSKTTSLGIQLVGTSGKSLVPTGTGTNTQADENAIKNFRILVYSNNLLEKSATVASADSVMTINDLSVGDKMVVVLVNVPTGFPTLQFGSSYNDLAAATNYISLDTQKDLTNGLFMSGESTVTLNSSPTPNTIKISVSRVTAKILLNSVTITPDPGYDINKFELTGVSIIKAKSKSSVGIPSVVTTDPLFSGIAGTTVTDPQNIKTFLFESITKANNSNKFFYIFANENPNNDVTLMTIAATYDGRTEYFPFEINTPDNKYIRPNTLHTINVTLKKIGLGTVDPEIPLETGVLDVTISPVDWIIEPVQNVED